MTEQDEQPISDLLCEIEKPGFRVCLQLANNRMECRADLMILPPEPEPEPEPPAFEAENSSPPRKLPAYELIAQLKQHHVDNIDIAAIYDFCAAVESGVEQQAILLARGTEPKTGADGWFELMVKTSGDEAEFIEDAHGRVDLRTRHAYTEIEAGQKIGILHQPQEGIPGCTVNGEVIPAERGRIYSLVAGEGVELKFDGRVAFATREGRALLERQVLTVVDQLVVSGDLDLKTGNIDFHGFVEVKGDVLDEFHIKASKGIKVGGVVGACRLESDGLVEIGSMAGKETGEVICKGDLKAGFLNQVKVECHGNVLVTNEIRNSDVKATGAIVVERGSIIGGSCVALEGIEAKILGATSGLETRLVAGVYFPDADRFDFLHRRRKVVDEQIERLRGTIGPLERLTNLDETTEKRLAILTEQWEKLEVERDSLQAEEKASTKQEQVTSNPKINVGSQLYDGVLIHLGNSSYKYKMVRKGPMSIIENTKRGGFRYLSLTPLPKLATELEQKEIEAERAAIQGPADASPENNKEES
ncbi:hypothetical protein SAMN02745165_01977 [Malonomonas rubra DSM 5091]|uniref:Flagellar Assembly Protein A N-terminal region domain-containing protein n=1 Tax=Malonomonas rubra DSM 5091 TaxID=1122189 RepID=A0A1M6I1X8_MALRU|nr:FapA family protein [Malonomonas rubra]SHJ28467.1 hypothetical protein SAMN02745165_01977 [Malonomonas rubra DSM 5091]